MLSNIFQKYETISFLELVSIYIVSVTNLDETISPRIFKQILNRIVFILDGLDEANPKLLRYLIQELSVINSPFIVSCRTNEYTLYVRNSELDSIVKKVELLPLDLNMIEVFSRKYSKILSIKNYSKQLNQQLIEDFLVKVRTDDTIFGIAKYPLMLTMLLHLYINNMLSVNETGWNIYKLYSQYTQAILAYETNKKQSTQFFNLELKQKVLIELAGYLFLNQRRHIKLEELNVLIQKLGISIDIYRIMDEICHHSLLDSRKSGECAFVHASFQDYYVAEYIIRILKYRDITTGTLLLKIHIPSNIERFLKYGLKSLDIQEIELIADSLELIYQKLEIESDKDKNKLNIMGRQQAAHYLSILLPYLPPLISKRVEQFLLSLLKKEKNKFITRGIRVGLFRHANRRDVLKEYLDLLELDREEQLVNCGYYLMYYGDQSSGYLDEGYVYCENTIKNILRHLLSRDHKIGWPLDLITLRQCIVQHKQRRALLISHGYLDRILSAMIEY